MSEALTNHQFTISKAVEDDAEEIRQAQFESWLHTYPNEELGIDELWIREQFKDDEKRNEFLRSLIRESLKPDSNKLYLVVKNPDGKPRGFLYVTRHADHAVFDAIYLTKDVQGTGVAHELMEHALDFAGHLPMKVDVADYNERAIHFYERYGFVKVPDSRRMHREKIPIIDLERPADKEKDEV
jgi:ribosomal protein S18 acetylase RimI-like enzyme